MRTIATSFQCFYDVVPAGIVINLPEHITTRFTALGPARQFRHNGRLKRTVQFIKRETG